MTTMVLSDLSVDKETARQKVEEYRSQLREHRTKEDLAIGRAFQVAAKGRPIVNLRESIKAGGLDEKGLPRLAVVRATATRCELWIGDNGLWFADDRRNTSTWLGSLTAAVGEWHVRIPWPDVGEVSRNIRGGWSDWPRTATAIVPIVPPNLRPPRRHRERGTAPDSLAACHIVWEAEWTNVAPRDPALIRRIGGDLWEVLATWDLTELERAVITGTRRA